MITFKISDENQQRVALILLQDIIFYGRKTYDVMVGPYEDFTLVELGIIIDGKDEKKLAEDFGEVLKEKGYVFERTDQIGLQFYEART